MRRLLASILLVAVAAAPAGAQEAGVVELWCGSEAPAPVVDVTGLMPGDRREVALDVCNRSSTPGTLVVSATPVAASGGPLAGLLTVAAADPSGTLWEAPVADLRTSEGEIGLAGGERRRLTLGVALSPAAGNDVAASTVAFDLVLRVVDADVEVLDATVIPVGPGLSPGAAVEGSGVGAAGGTAPAPGPRAPIVAQLPPAPQAVLRFPGRSGEPGPSTPLALPLAILVFVGVAGSALLVSSSVRRRV
jgi:hypothetical protein